MAPRKTQKKLADRSSQPPVDVELALALDDVEIPPDVALKLRAVLARLVEVPLDLNEMPEEHLLETDSVAQNRRNYIGSLLRFWHFLARKPDDFDQESLQARMALGYIKHAEGSKTLQLSIGRTAGDSKMVEEVARLRNEMYELAKMRQVTDVQVVPDTPPTEGSDVLNG